MEMDTVLPLTSPYFPTSHLFYHFPSCQRKRNEWNKKEHAITTFPQSSLLSHSPLPCFCLLKLLYISLKMGRMKPLATTPPFPSSQSQTAGIDLLAVKEAVMWSRSGQVSVSIWITVPACKRTVYISCVSRRLKMPYSIIELNTLCYDDSLLHPNLTLVHDNQ